MGFTWVSDKTAEISPNIISRLVFVTVIPYMFLEVDIGNIILSIDPRRVKNNRFPNQVAAKIMIMGWTSRVRFPAEARLLFFTRFGILTASYPMHS
jgi:hypothetical protein